MTELTDEAAEARFDAPLPDEQHVMAMLAALPPVTMPRELSDSISAALADESARRTASSTPAEPPQGQMAEVIDLRSRRGRWVGAVAGIAAAAVALAGAAYVMRPHNAQVVGDLGPVLASGSDYTTGQLSSEVPELLNNAGLGTGQSTARIAPADAAQIQNTFTATDASIRSCVAQFSEAGDVTLVAIDLAKYQGNPAAVVVTQTPGATELTATVVSTTCGASGPQVLARTTIAAP